MIEKGRMKKKRVHIRKDVKIKLGYVTPILYVSSKNYTIIIIKVLTNINFHYTTITNISSMYLVLV